MLDFLQRTRPPRNEGGALRAQDFVPEFKLVHRTLPFLQILQQRVTLREHLGVLAHGICIGRINLRNGGIQIASPVPRRALHQHHILREEHYHVDHARKLPHPPLQPVHQHSLFQALVALSAVGLQLETHLNRARFARQQHFGTDSHERLWFLAQRKPVYQLAVAARVRGVGGGKVVNGFKQAGLSLRVAPHQNERPGGQPAFKTPIVAKVGEG